MHCRPVSTDLKHTPSCDNCTKWLRSVCWRPHATYGRNFLLLWHHVTSRTTLASLPVPLCFFGKGIIWKSMNLSRLYVSDSCSNLGHPSESTSHSNSPGIPIFVPHQSWSLPGFFTILDVLWSVPAWEQPTPLHEVKTTQLLVFGQGRLHTPRSDVHNRFSLATGTPTKWADSSHVCCKL